MVLQSFEAYCMAMERVARRLRRVTETLNEAGVRYAVIGVRRDELPDDERVRDRSVASGFIPGAPALVPDNGTGG